MGEWQMDPNLTTVILALIAAVVAPVVTFVIKYVQDRNIAEKASSKATTIAENADAKLDGIHHLVDGRLSEALDRINQLEALLQKSAPAELRKNPPKKRLITLR